MRRAAFELSTTIHCPSSEENSHSWARVWNLTVRYILQAEEQLLKLDLPKEIERKGHIKAASRRESMKGLNPLLYPCVCAHTKKPESNDMVMKKNEDKENPAKLQIEAWFIYPIIT